MLTAHSDVIVHEPFEVYRDKAKHYLSSHQLGDFRKCPQLYHDKKLGLIKDEDRPAYQIGRAAHTLILEGRERFKESYAVGGPINPKTGTYYGAATKAFAEWAESQGKPVLTPEYARLAEQMAASVHKHAHASSLLASGTAECVVRENYRVIDCQIRMDWYAPETGIVDLKTCDDLDYFEADARRFKYLHQLAFYRSVLAAALGVPAHSIPVHLIAVEKKPPFRAGKWFVDPDALRQATSENEAAMERLKACLRSGAWPTGYEEPRYFNSI